MMKQEFDIEEISRKIKLLKKTAMGLKEISLGIQAIDRNADRILSNIAMLEKNVVEAYEIAKKKSGAK